MASLLFAKRALARRRVQIASAHAAAAAWYARSSPTSAARKAEW
jgi:hypothetical protein